MTRMNCSSMLSLALSAALLVVAPLSAAGQLYKWVDAEGNVTYSDKPPPTRGVTQQKTLPKPAAVTPAQGAAQGTAPSGAKSVAEQEMEFRKRRLEAAEAEAKRQQQSDEEAKKRANCEQAKARVAMLQAGGRITRASPSGEAIYMDDAEIARELVEARKVADSWCSP